MYWFATGMEKEMIEALFSKKTLSTNVLPAEPGKQANKKEANTPNSGNGTNNLQAQQLRLFLIEDTGLLRAGLASLFQSRPDFDLVGQNGMDGSLEAAQGAKPDIILVGVNEEAVNGLNLVERLKSFCPYSRVIAIGPIKSPSFVRKIVAMGASGYLSWQTTADDLFTAIKRVQLGHKAIDDRIAGLLLDRFLSRQESGQLTSTLTKREAEVLKMIAWGYTGAQIAERLCVSKHTIDTHRARAAAKLSLKDRSEIIGYAVEQGWMEERPPSSLEES